MVLEPFFLFSIMVFLLSNFLSNMTYAHTGSLAFYWVCGGIKSLILYLNCKWIFFPAIKTYFTVTSVEDATIKYYENAKLHRRYDHPVIRAFAEPKVKWIVSKLSLREKKVLDVGGGNGFFTQFLTKECPNLHCLDISPQQLKMNPLPEEKKHHGTAYKMPYFKDNSFDVVFASNLLHHLDRPEVAMKEFHRIAKEHVIIVEPSNANPFMRFGSYVASHEYGARLQSKARVEKLITDTGLQMVHHTYQGGCILPNRTHKMFLPIAMKNSCNKWLSYFQIFISKK